MFTYYPGNKSALLVLSLIALAAVFGCKPAVDRIYHHESSHYYILNNSSDLDIIQKSVMLNAAAPVELVGGELCVIKKEYHSEKRNIKDIDYAGSIFYYDRIESITIERVLGLKYDNDFANKFSEVKRMLAQRPLVKKGFVLLMDSLTTLTLQQTRELTQSGFSCLIFESIPYISTEQAEVFSGFNGKSLCLNGLLWLSIDQTNALADFEGDYLGLNKIRSLTREQAEILCRFQGDKIYLAGLNPNTKIMMKEYQDKAIASLVFD